MSFQLDTRSKGRLNAGKRAYPSSAGSAAAALQAAAASSVILNLVDPDPDSFLNNVEQVKEQLTVANRLLQALTSLLKSNDITQVQSKMHQCMQQTKDATLRLQTLLTYLGQMSAEAGITKKEREARKLLEAKLAKDFHEFRSEFVKVAKLAAQRREQREAVSHTPQRGSSAEESTGLLNGARGSALNDDDDDDDDGPGRHVEHLQLEADLTFNHAVISERHDQVKQIHEDMADVTEMFNDLATLVDDQGVMINDLERHISSTKDKTLDGQSQLKKAAEHQKKGRMQLCCVVCLFVLLMAIGAFTILQMLAVK